MKWKVGRRYDVTWIDTFQSINNDWQKVEDADFSPMIMKSSGYLIHKSKHYITLTPLWKPDTKEFAGRLHIPIGCIKKVK